jgi:formate hydrogenlyase transcriptional activator
MNLPLRVAERYRTLLEVNRAAISQPSPEAVFSVVCKAVRNVMPYDRASLALYEPAEDAFRLVARHGAFENSFFHLGIKVGRKDSPAGWAFDRQTAIVRRDLETERCFPIEEHTLAEGLRSYCAVPLMVRGDCIGILSVVGCRKDQFRQIHAQFLQEVSDQIVLAIKSFWPQCSTHSQTRLVCPKCIASWGGQTTTAKYKEHLSSWGRKGGRGNRKPAGGLATGLAG